LASGYAAAPRLFARSAVGDCRTALELFSQVSDRFGEAATHDSLGQAHHRLGQHDEATTAFAHSLKLLRHLGDRYYEAVTTIHLGDAHRDAGQAAPAREAWQRALSILEELRHPDADDVRARLDT